LSKGVFLDECQELIHDTGTDVIAVLAAVFINLGAQAPSVNTSRWVINFEVVTIFKVAVCKFKRLSERTIPANISFVSSDMSTIS
jgi:hypothetical protein